jgi:hypothetical protein
MLRFGRIALVHLALVVPLTRAAAAIPAEVPPPADPLRLVPASVDLVLQVSAPQLLAWVMQQPSYQRLRELAPVQELLETAQVRRFFQVVDYLGQRLNLSRTELLSRLAGNGAVLGVRLGKEPAAALLVLQGQEEAWLQRFLTVSRELVEEELARREIPARWQPWTHQGIKGWHLAEKLYAAPIGAALVLSNDRELAQEASARAWATSERSNPQWAEARRLLPAQPLAWLWLNLEPIRQQPGVREVLPQIEDFPLFTPFVAPWFDVMRRSPYLSAALTTEGQGLRLTLRLPRGTEGMSGKARLFLPETSVALRPLLEPANTQFTAAMYLDLHRLWQQRQRFLDKKSLEELEKFEKNSGLYLGGVRLSKLLSQAGSQIRFVQVADTRAVRPKEALAFPPFALVLEMRDPELARRLGTVLRTAALLATTQVPMKMVEEEYHGCKLVSYRFLADKLPSQGGKRFPTSISPTFGAVKDQFLLSSTVELARELVDELQQEPRGTTVAASCWKLSAAGIAASLRPLAGQLQAQFVLGQALPPEEAQKQVAALFRLLEGLGYLEAISIYQPQDYSLELRWQPRAEK